MSNIVTIHTDILITEDNLDILKLLADMEAHDYVNEVGFKKYFAPEATDEEFIFYWFLGSDNFYEDEDEPGLYVLSLGNHRSEHTWRDLQHLETFLGKYLKTPEGSCLQCPCQMSDESDGFQETYQGNFTVKR